MSKSLDDIILFAAKVHAGQTRKETGIPYIVHPLNVLWKIADWGIRDKNLWKAAICHDILEDCDVTEDVLRKLIGAEAFSIVEELTFKPIADSKFDAKTQKQQYLDLFGGQDGFYSKSIDATVLKFADRICNTIDFASSSPDYARKYWKKAEALLGVVTARKEEIVQKFGPDTFPNMRYSQTCINQMLNY